MYEALPDPPRGFVARLMEASFSCLCIGLDSAGRLISQHGDPRHFGLRLPAPGQSLGEALPVMVGLDLQLPQVLERITLQSGMAVDLHVLPGPPAWLVLIDRSDLVNVSQEQQQAANESRLVNVEQRRLMDQLIDSKAELALRTQEIEDSNRRKTEFIAGMAHEFRTPLTSVLGYSQLLAERLREDAVSVSYLAAVDRAARHLLSLVENNLDQARLEAGTMVIHRVDAELRQMVDDLTAIMAPLAADKGLSFGAFVEHRVPDMLWLDDVRLRQVLVNLLSNAVKFTDEGEVRLTVDWQNGELICTASDTGPGIPAAARARIFDAFERLENTQLKPGAGLGLNITLRLVQLMGGEIELESETGKGSAFKVRLPARAGRVVQRKTGHENLGEHLARRAREPATILVAEDSPDIMLLLEAFLVPAGYELIKVSDGRQAVAQALSRSPPLVILDLNMPELDGMQAAAELRKAGFKGSVIALTASRGAEHRQAALAGGFDEFLSKPIQMPQLLSTLERLLERR